MGQIGTEQPAIIVVPDESPLTPEHIPSAPERTPEEVPA